MNDRLAAWAAQTSPSPGPSLTNGNDAWAQGYAQELRQVSIAYANRLPRNVQRHLGPSELGHHCDRQLVGKMAGVVLPRRYANNLHDPWASMVGTAIHAFLEEAFKWDAGQAGTHPGRWATERRVTPDPLAVQPHPGTADLYDVFGGVLGDHKAQSEAVRAKLRREGPPFHYFVQMLLYALGYMNEGFPVERIALISWPRTKSTLDDLYVWSHVITVDDLKLVNDVLDKTQIREELAKYVADGSVDLFEIPATPSDADCSWCPFFNPSATGSGSRSSGCPGTAVKKSF